MGSWSNTGDTENFDYGGMHAVINVTTTDYNTYTKVTVICSAKAWGSGYWSRFIRGRASSVANGTYGDYSEYKSVNIDGAPQTVEMIRHTFNVDRTTVEQKKTYWAAINGGGTGMYSGDYESVSVTISIPALPSHKIKYNLNGGTGNISEQTKFYGIDLSLNGWGSESGARPPTRTGYNFEGWSTSSTATVATYTNNSHIYNINQTTAVTLYAVWTERTYPIEYIPNMPSGETVVNFPYTTDTKYYFTTFKISPVVPTCESGGYQFKGWSLNTLTFEVKYYPNDDYNYNEPTLFFAVWEKTLYKITYNANKPFEATGTVTNIPAEGSKLYQDSYPISQTCPALNGYTFKGWSTSPSATHPDQGYTVEDINGENPPIYSNDADLNLYAVWQINSHTVHFNANLPSSIQEQPLNFPADQTKEYKIDLIISNSIPTLSAYNFIGWGELITENDIQLKYSKQVIQNNQALYDEDKDLTLYALWEEKTYNIAYNANLTNIDQTRITNIPSNQIKYHFTDLVLSSTIPTVSPTTTTYVINFNSNGGNSINSITITSVSSYNFNEWNTSSNYTGTSYSPEDLYTINEDVTLYADWGYDVQINPSIPITLPTPSRTNYNFRGWYDGESLVSTNFIPNKSVTNLEARWEIKTFTISYNVNGGQWSQQQESEEIKSETFNITADNVAIISDQPIKYAPGDADNYIITFDFQNNGKTPWQTAQATGMIPFLNWNTKQDGSGISYNSNSAYTEAKSINLYAQWDDNAPGNSNIKLITPESRIGYIFEGWYLDSKYEFPVIEDSRYDAITDTFVPDENITFFAKWRKVNFKITYRALVDGIETDLNVNGIPSLQEIELDGESNSINFTISDTEPNKKQWTSDLYIINFYDEPDHIYSTTQFNYVIGYIFAGWNTQWNGQGTKYDKGKSYNITIENQGNEENYNLILYAQWTEQLAIPKIHLPFTLEEEPNNFGGWYEDINYINKVNDTNGYIIYTSPPQNFNISYYAKWNLGEYVIKYNANGGLTSSIPAQQIKQAGSNLTLSQIVPRKAQETFGPYNVIFNYNDSDFNPKDAGYPTEISTGIRNTINYKFINWNSNSEGTGTSYNPNDIYSRDGNITLYAQWQHDVNTIIHSIVLPQPVREGYVFEGWYKDSRCSTKVETIVENSEERYIPWTDGIILYAKWTVQNYTINYYLDNNEIYTSQIKIHNKPLILINSSPKNKDNYIFIKWNTHLDGTGQSYSPGDSYNLNGNQNLYAMWQPITTLTEWLSKWETDFASIEEDIPGNQLRLITESINADGDTTVTQYDTPALMFQAIKNIITHTEPVPEGEPRVIQELIYYNIGYGYKLKLNLINPYGDTGSANQKEELERVIFIPAKKVAENKYVGYYQVPEKVKIADLFLYDNAQATINYQTNIDLNYTNNSMPQSYEVVETVVGQIDEKLNNNQNITPILQNKYYAHDKNDDIVYEYSLDSWYLISFSGPIGTKIKISTINDPIATTYTSDEKGLYIAENINGEEIKTYFNSQSQIKDFIIVSSADPTKKSFINYKANIMQRIYM